MSLRAVPYVKLLLPFVLGLSAGALIDQPVPMLTRGLFAGALCLVYIAGRKFPYRYRWIFGVALALLLFGLGYLRAYEYNELRQADHFSGLSTPVHHFTGLVSSIPVKGKRWKVPLRVESINNSISCSGAVLLLIDPGGPADSLQYGDRVEINAPIDSIPPSGNPDAFDYRRYLHFQNIHFQAFVKKDSLRVRTRGQGNPVWSVAYFFRAKVLDILAQHFPGPDEYAVAAALLIGEQDYLSDEIRSAYAQTGSMHALAVSGTHVGMLYVGLLFLLRTFRLRGRRGKILEMLLVLSAIWAFTLLTGASASVLRASVMFSVFLLGRSVFRRTTSIWNILAVSAFLLLFYNPYFLFDAGCQLSYSAVVGMVFFYPRFYRISPLINNRIGAEMWKMLLVGCSAQLGTLPLSLYYFHQFPLYFWLSGWIVVTGGAIFLAGGSLLILLQFAWPFAAIWTGKALCGMVWFMNHLIFWIQKLPFSVLEGIWVPLRVLPLLYLLLFLFAAGLAKRQGKWWLAGLLLLFGLGSGRFWRIFHQQTQQEIVVYQVGKSTLIDCISGRDVLCLTDSVTVKQEKFAAQQHRWALGTRAIRHVSLDSISGVETIVFNNPVLHLNGKKIALIRRNTILPDSPSQPVDLILITGNPKLDIAECQLHFPAPLVVLDASNSRYKCRKWREECAQNGWKYHDIREEGAFIIHH